MVTEYYDQTASCMRGKGFDAIALPASKGGGVRYTSGSQATAADAAMKACEEALGQSPDTRTVTVALMTKYYRWGLRTRTCLQKLGYPVSEPPSLATYIANFSTAKQWTAYGEISSPSYQLSSGELNVLNRKCPQVPPSSQSYKGP